MAGSFELLTNEWLPASGNKWIGREVLCMFKKGEKVVATFNGFYWVDQEGQRVKETVGNPIMYFYIFEKFNENDIL